MPVPPSPCRKLCTLDPRSGLCLGCGRTLPEIESWLALSDAKRRAVAAELPARLAALRGQAAAE